MNDIVKKGNNLVLSKNLQDRFRRNRTMGSEDVYESLPILKVVTANSKNVFLNNGKKAPTGTIYHPRLKQAWDEVEVRVLAIKGCELPNMNGELKKTYLVAGVIDNDELTEFVFYCKGMNYGELFPFFKELNPIKNDPKNPIPMYALKVKLGIVERSPLDPRYKDRLLDVITFKIVRDDNYSPVVENNGELLDVLESGVLKAKRVMSGIIESKGVSDEDAMDGEVGKLHNEEFVEPTREELSNVLGDVDVEDIPDDL